MEDKVEDVDKNVNCSWNIGQRVEIHVLIENVPYVINIPNSAQAVDILNLSKLLESIGLDIIKQQEESEKDPVEEKED